MNSFNKDLWGPCLVLGMAPGAAASGVNEADASLLFQSPSILVRAADDKEKTTDISLDSGKSSGENKAS